MFDTLARTVPKDADYPARTWRLAVLGRVLDGTIYDGLQHEFHDEKSDGGEYIPLRKRRPSVRYNLCRLVVEDSIALLFGEGHFPTVDLADPKDRGALAEIIKESRLPQVMASASLIGSTGSVAILMRVLRGRVFFCEMGTGFLTPTYDPEAPDTLASVTERYKVRGGILAAQGYAIPLDAQDADWWFQRVWDTTTESWYLPQSVSDAAAGKKPALDAGRTVRHGLGFVPMVWIRNLPGGDDVDGACTFRAAIDTQIEIEYQLSQAGRGLKYSSDPLLLIKEPATSDDQIVRSAGNALVVSEKGDAKMLEIGGTAADAVISYVRALREMALESVHGNRSSADKLSAAQSGRALELMHQPLIWLADQLRTSYGENGVLPLARMVIEASRKMRLKVKGKDIAPFGEDAYPTLRWPGWFAPTVSDQEQQATALSTSRRAGHISRETAVKSIAATYDIEDVDAELQRIQADDDAEDARVARNAAKTTAVEPLSD
jgi:hypothetical protein